MSAAFPEIVDLTASASEDELNIGSTKPVHSVSASPERASHGRILRTRKLSVDSTVSKKRKRVQSQNQDTTDAKRVKMDDKKAATAVVNKTRVELEKRRKIWLHKHKAIFQPLLPANTVLFANIEHELENDNCMLSYTPLHQLEEQPSLIKGGTMKDYQLEGLSFLVWMHKNGMSSILGDEMGLGKTLQTLSLLAYVKENTKGTQDPHLIICPLSVLSSWEAEAARWLPSMSVLRIHGSSSERSRLKDLMRTQGNVDICLTTYETYVAEENFFKSHRWTYCVLDEGHKIKNATIALSTKMHSIGALHRLILTGTPVQNNLLELWGLLHWLYPHVFTDASERIFKDAFNLKRGEYALPIVKAAQTLLSTIMIRRTKATVELSVPPREELTVFIPLSEAQRFWTYRLLTRLDQVDLSKIFSLGETDIDEGRKQVMENLAKTNAHPSEGTRAWKKLMNLLMQLRKVCDHPYLLKDVEPSPFRLGEHIVASSSKLVAIDKILGDVLPKGERVLIFSQWMGMLDLLEDFCALRGIKAARLDGSTSRVRRALDIRLFQQHKSPHQVFIISTKAGGLGINLTKASTVIMCDSDWNPQNDLQAIARAHRIGQVKTVNVYRLICRGSVEDQMLDRIRRKLFLSVKVMGSDNPVDSDDSTGMCSSELLDILRRGSSALSSTDDGMNLDQFLKAPIEAILQESRIKDEIKTAKMQKDLNCEVENEALLESSEEEERRLMSGVAQVKSRLFEGQLVSRTQSSSNKETAKEWEDSQKRDRVNRLVTVNGIQSVVVTQEVVPRKIVQPIVRGPKFDSEDHCIYCNDGGTLFLCRTCPRAYHASCDGLSPRGAKGVHSAICPQHSCAECDRSTSDAGGMLFRCRFCPRALCEDCVGDNIDCVGDVLTEFALLGFGEKSSAYYIKCGDCVQHFKKNPGDWAIWQKVIASNDRKLKAVWKKEEKEYENAS